MWKFQREQEVGVCLGALIESLRLACKVLSSYMDGLGGVAVDISVYTYKICSVV